MLANLLLVAAGGALGSCARYAISILLAPQVGVGRFPWATFTANTLGCLIAGLLLGLALRQGVVGAQLRVFLFAGFLGGFTTFSAFGVETFALLRRGDVALAGWNIAASVAIGLAALWIGFLALAPRQV